MDHENLDDPAIRKIFIPYLGDHYLTENRSAVIEEVAGKYIRTDLTAFDQHQNQVHGVEIKSDRDSLTRLRKQIENYDLTHTHCHIVTGERFADKVAELIPPYWYQHVIIDGTVDSIHEGYRNPMFDASEFLVWFDSKNLKKMIKSAGGRRYSKLMVYQLVDMLADLYRGRDDDLLDDAIPYLLTEKHWWLQRAHFF